MTEAPATLSDRLIRRAEVLQIVPVSSPTLWRWERDGKFPKRITLARNLVAWKLSEVMAWLDEQGKEDA